MSLCFAILLDDLFVLLKSWWRFGFWFWVGWLSRSLEELEEKEKDEQNPLAHLP
jgi:hypothetical protein